MDNKAIFARTSKGDDEVHSKTTHLGGDVKRALLMVDGAATFGEISKRAAPSLRANLESLLQELEKDGFIQDNTKSLSASKISAPHAPHKISVPPKMSAPLKMAIPAKSQSTDDDAGGEELDFMSGFSASPPQSSAAEDSKAEEEARKLKAEAEAKIKQEIDAAKLKAQQEAETKAKQELEAAKLKMHQEAEAKARLELEAAKIKAKKEAEAILLMAEQEAAKLREETTRRAKAEAEVTRLKAEQEALRLRGELEAEKIKAEQQAKLQLAAATKVRQQAEAARIKAEQEAAQMHAELEAAKAKAEMESQARLEASAKAHARMKAAEEAMAREAAENQARQQAVKATPSEPGSAVVPNAFSFEAFQVGEPQAAPSQAISNTGDQSTARAESATATPTPKPGAFAFDSFKVDASPPIEGDKSSKTKPIAAPKEPVSTTKPDTFSFDSFEVEEPRPQVKQQPAHVPSSAPPPNTEARIPEKETPPAAEQSSQTHIETKAEKTQPDQEQFKRAEQERLAAEARAKKLAEAQAHKQADEHAKKKIEEEQAKKLADEQARVWAEAEQRALETAKANAERVLHQAEHPVAESAPATSPVARTRHGAFSMGKLIGFMFKLSLFLLVLLVAALFAVPYFMPMRDYMPKVEQLLSEQLKQPVHIGYLSGRILPTPRLELGEIYIGEVKQFQAKQAQLNFSLIGLLDEKKPIDSVVLQNIKVSGKGLLSVSSWLQKLVKNDQYPVSRMEITQGTLDADIFELNGIEGEFNFDSAGKFAQANIRANSGKYTLDIHATPEDKLQVAISVNGSTLPLLPNWAFDNLTAKGELKDDELLINDFDARMLGGALQGNASINWRSGWRAQGALNAKTITLKQLNALLDGNVDGSVRFKMSSQDLAGLTNSSMLEGNFTANGGTINGMDIGETARLHSKEHLPGGRTHFNELSGAILFADNLYHFKQIKINTDTLNATATLDIDKRQLSGNIIAKLSIPEGMVPVDLQIGGVFDNPTLRAAR